MGARHRLDRDLTGWFGGEDYAKEELIAELRDDKRCLVQVASADSKATDFLFAVLEPDGGPEERNGIDLSEARPYAALSRRGMASYNVWGVREIGLRARKSFAIRSCPSGLSRGRAPDGIKSLEHTTVSTERAIVARPLTADIFEPFGTVIEALGEPSRLINGGLCGRYHDLCAPDVAPDVAEEGRVGLSVFDAEPCTLPYRLDLLERHPIGSQAFVPMHAEPFLVTVASDEDGVPGPPLAFVTDGRQGIQIARNVWHGVLTPLAAPGLFTVIDYCGARPNLEEHRLAAAWTVVAS